MEMNEIYAPRVLALGAFDGVHLGHRELIRLGKRRAEEIGGILRVCTFDRHPLEILQPDRAPQMLTTAEEQKQRITAAGAKEIWRISFDTRMAETEPEDFLKMLREACNLKAVVAGWNYTFGKKGRGNAELLCEDGKKYGYETIIVPSVRTEAGEIISSSAIREKLLKGDAAGASEMLGDPYPISGTVVNGKHQGSRIGFPTANIRAEAKKLLPAFGVYLCRLRCGDENWPAIVNIGIQPTIPSGQVTVEAHALGAENIDLYGREARLELLSRLRDEIRFPDVEALKEQIRRDRDAAEAFFLK